VPTVVSLSLYNQLASINESEAMLALISNTLSRDPASMPTAVSLPLYDRLASIGIKPCSLLIFNTLEILCLRKLRQSLPPYKSASFHLIY
jgi:hypothetical protein